MRKAAHAEQRNRRIGRRHEPDARRTDHHERTQHNAANARPHQRNTDALDQERRQVTAGQAAQVSRQEWQPREHGDGFQIEVTLVDEVKRNPKAERLPGRFGKKARQRNRPEAAGRHDVLDRALAALCARRAELPADDLFALGVGQRGMVFWRTVEGKPQRGPQEADGASHHKRRLPAVTQMQEDHQRRRQHRTQRGARIEPADGDGLFLVREPFGHGLHAGRNGSGFGQAHQGAKARQRQPAGSARVQHASKRPQHTKQRKADTQTDQINDKAADGLHDRVAHLKGRDHVGILLGAHPQLALEGGRQHAQRVTRQIVDDRAQAHQHDDPPAQALDGLHGVVSDIFLLVTDLRGGVLRRAPPRVPP